MQVNDQWYLKDQMEKAEWKLLIHDFFNIFFQVYKITSIWIKIFPIKNSDSVCTVVYSHVERSAEFQITLTG